MIRAFHTSVIVYLFHGNATVVSYWFVEWMSSCLVFLLPPSSSPSPRLPVTPTSSAPRTTSPSSWSPSPTSSWPRYADQIKLFIHTPGLDPCVLLFLSPCVFVRSGVVVLAELAVRVVAQWWLSSFDHESDVKLNARSISPAIWERLAQTAEKFKAPHIYPFIEYLN